MTGRARFVVRNVVWLIGLGAALIVLHALGSGPLAAPPIAAGGRAVGRWVATRDAATIVIALLRVLAMAIAAYLLVTTMLAWTARATRSASVMMLSDRVTVGLVRRMVAGSVGLAIAAGPLTAPPSAWAAAPATAAAPGTASPAPPTRPAAPASPPTSLLDDPPVLRRLPDDLAGSPSSPGPGPVFPAPEPTPAASAPAPSTLVPPAPVPSAPVPSILIPSTLVPSTSAPPTLLPPTAVTPAPASTIARPPAAAATDTDRPDGAPTGPPTGTWTVQPGEHLWLIAARTLCAARGRAVSDAEIAPYWVEVVRQNRSRLPDPANADLLYPGMTVIVPPVP